MNNFLENPYLQMGMGILGGNYGPSKGAAFANAMQGGLLGMQQARQGQMQKQKLAMQQQAAQLQQIKLAQAQKEREDFEKFVATLPPQERAMARGYPEMYRAIATQKAKSQFPGAATFGTTAHMFKSKTDPNDVVIGQMSTGLGAFTLDAQGNPVQIDQSKYIYHRPLSVQNYGDVTGTVNTVTGQGARIGPGQGASMPQPAMSPTMPPMGVSEVQTPSGPVTVTNEGTGSPAEWQAAMQDVQAQPVAPAVAPATGLPTGDPTTGRMGVKPGDQPPVLAAQETAKLEAKAAFEKKAREPKVRRMGHAMRRKNDMLAGSFNQVRNNTSGWTTGFIGKMGSFVPGSPQNDLEKALSPIVANLGFDKLQDMRDNSPTGGALGQVSERELALLISAVRSLEQSQSEDQFRENLDAVEQHYNDYLTAYAQAYQEDYGKPLFAEDERKRASADAEVRALRKELGLEAK
ncbi:MAG: hypothetical protein KJN90_06510 [Gammaproteobacteria bacterium]|nr:hypothetical protein [Gammaproteobacteria bacterium]